VGHRRSSVPAPPPTGGTWFESTATLGLRPLVLKADFSGQACAIVVVFLGVIVSLSCPGMSRRRSELVLERRALRFSMNGIVLGLLSAP
jgi:hypothetical protein